MPTVLQVTLNAPTLTVASTVMTRGSTFGDFGYGTEGFFFAGAFGSLADDLFYKGEQCRGVYSNTNTSPSNFRVAFLGTFTQDFFTTIETSIGTFDTGDVVAFISGTGGLSSNFTIWQWESVPVLSGTGTETITITGT